MLYVLAYPVFDPSCAERINAFRERHEPKRANLVPPHITLVFGVAGKHLNTLSGLLDQVAADTGAFDVTFATSVIEFDPFEAKHKMFLMCDDGRDHITTLHTRLYDGAHRAELSAAHPFKPHMTVASCETRADVARIEVADIGAFPIRAAISALELVRLEGGRLTTLRTVPLTA